MKDERVRNNGEGEIHKGKTHASHVERERERERESERARERESERARERERREKEQQENGWRSRAVCAFLNLAKTKRKLIAWAPMVWGCR